VESRIGDSSKRGMLSLHAAKITIFIILYYILILYYYHLISLMWLEDVFASSYIILYYIILYYIILYYIILYYIILYYIILYYMVIMAARLSAWLLGTTSCSWIRKTLPQGCESAGIAVLLSVRVRAKEHCSLRFWMTLGTMCMEGECSRAGSFPSSRFPVQQQGQRIEVSTYDQRYQCTSMTAQLRNRDLWT